MMFLANMAVSAYAQEKFELGKPNDDNYRYLDNYLALKEYIDYSKYPNFKLGIGTTANDYIRNSTVKNLTNKNFTETVAGNAMKMASCVDDKGNMNFSTVTSYVNAATNAGLNVYGHTLAWHSQQPMGWLRKLLQDKPAPELTDGDVNNFIQIYTKNFCTSQNVGWTSDKSKYGFSINFSSTNGLNVHTTKTCGSWEVQFVSAENIPTEANKTYRMTMMVKGSKSGNLHSKLGDWDYGATADIPFTTQWQEATVNYKAEVANSFFLLQCGDFVGDIYIKNVKFEEKQVGRTVEEDRRCLVVHATKKYSNAWDNQMWLVPGSFSQGASYVFKADVRADKQASVSTQIHSTPGTQVSNDAFGDINFTTDWKTITIRGNFSKAGQSIALNLNEFAGENNYYFDNVSLRIGGIEKIKNGNFEGTTVTSFQVKEYGSEMTSPTISDAISYVYVPSTVPLTQQEMHDTLVYAMDKWIKGMMNACNGKVKGWDLVNEAISGGGDDGSGNYTLQHSKSYNPNGTWDVGGDAFYWQDYMGDLEYVRQACRLARKYGPDDVALFINDYNLESDWDGNKKLKSLINWIKKWEADGVTYIDGIGSQMHISYYENQNTLNSKKNAIVNMLNLLAQSGKLVRISEMDMGYVDSNDNQVTTENMTEQMHKRMANYYAWIIDKYLTIIPPEQQWGICQWCATDAPSYSGWRGGEPVGIWDLNNNRKHVYAGFVRGLGGVPYAIDNVESDDDKLNKDDVIYNLNGCRIAQGDKFDTLPSGIYIVKGKKIMKF